MASTINAQKRPSATCIRELFLCGLAYTIIVVCLWGINGLHNGFSGETALIYTSDVNHGYDGFFYADPLRKFTSLFYHFSYLLGAAAGHLGSFIPYQIVYGCLWLLRAVLTYGIVRQLMPDRPALALFAGLAASLYSADGSSNWIGQLNQFGFIFMMLLSFWLLSIAFATRSAIGATLFAAAAALAGYVSLWSYESPLPVMLAFPVVVVALQGRLPSRSQLLAIALFYVPVAVFSFVNIERYASSIGTASYQASVTRPDMSVGAIVSDLIAHLDNSLFFWAWPHAVFQPSRALAYLTAFIPVLASLIVVIVVALRAEGRQPEPFKPSARVIGFGVLSAGLMISSYLVILLLKDNRYMWRTEFLPSFATSCFIATLLYLLLRKLPRALWRAGVAICLFGCMGAYGTFAGVNSGLFFHSLWERHRLVMSSIVANAPDVADGTLFVLRNVDRTNDPFGHNMWFDISLRLAYPGREIAGIYEFAGGEPSAGSNVSIVKDQPTLEPGGFPTLLHSDPSHPVSRMLVFDYDANSGEADPVRSGPITIGLQDNALKGYDFCRNISGSLPSPIAVERFAPIKSQASLACPTR
ncbi:hypothetical protein SAMN05519103_00550 [Rhizobiales bacterium GAS113]|nr:hypothetical protein SAMN05519103_00550 [Rhizobiales bacterium GAS113]